MVDKKEPLDWKFTQIFGDKTIAAQLNDEDIISALQFDSTGNYLSLGDKAGRLIIFENMSPPKGKTKMFDYQYLTELQSHNKEFDTLKTCEVEERINQIQWLRHEGKNMYLLSTNDKTVKLWKISEKTIKKVISGNRGVQTEKDLKLPKLQTTEKSLIPTMRKVYPSVHGYHINSISVSSNSENFISSDDLRVYLWNLENTKEAFNIVDTKPENLDELSEVITASQFHPIDDSVLIYSTSKGIIKLCDLRKNSLGDTAPMTLEEKEDPASKNFFTEIVASISDVVFSANGRYIFSRDFLSVNVWDLHMPNKPVSKIQIYEPLKSKLCELYENECIFDKFSISSSPCSNYFVTGMFNSNFHVCDRNGDMNTQFELNFNKKLITKQIPRKHFETLGPNYDFTQKILRSAWHPNLNCVAVACLNCLYFYNS